MISGASIRACSRREGLQETAILELIQSDPQGRTLFARLERGQVSQEYVESFIGERLGINPERLLSRMCADLRPNQPMLDTLTALRATGVRTAVLSNSWGAGYFDPYLLCDLHSYAEVVLRSDEVGVRKPDRAIYELLTTALDVDPTDCVFVDDVAANLPPAQSLGMRAVHHTSNDTTLSTLRSCFAQPSSRH